MAKPYLTISQQITKLSVDKGLIINDQPFAEFTLTNIGYFSLIGGYKNMFTNPMTRKYVNSTKFEDIVALYQFDDGLRQLTFKYLMQVEQKLRQLISDSFCSYYGEQQSFYLSANCYNPSRRLGPEIAKLINILDYHANRNSEKAYLVHQRTHYHNVPLWVTTKVLTFGQLSKFYQLLQFRQQSDISKHYENVTEKNLGQYLTNLTLFRNVCAHNERLFSFRLQKDFPDTVLHKKLRIPMKGTQYANGKRDYFGLVIALRYLLPRQDFLTYKKSLIALIKSYTRKSSRIAKRDLLSRMGFPPNWEHITRYKM